MRTESKKHKEIREQIAKLINGINDDDKTRITRGYYPDITTETLDVEVEIYNKKRHLFNKKNNWNNNKRKILIIGIPDELSEIFDDVILFNNKNNKHTSNHKNINSDADKNNTQEDDDKICHCELITKTTHKNINSIAVDDGDNNNDDIKTTNTQE